MEGTDGEDMDDEGTYIDVCESLRNTKSRYG